MNKSIIKAVKDFERNFPNCDIVSLSYREPVYCSGIYIYNVIYYDKVNRCCKTTSIEVIKD